MVTYVESKETSFEMLVPELLANVDAKVSSGITRNYYIGGEKLNSLPELDKVEVKKIETVNSLESSEFKTENMFALRFRGYINVPEDGMYTISSKSTRSFDFVTFHEIKIQSRGNNESSKEFPLKKGLHPIQIDHYVEGGPSDYKLFIEGPNMEKQQISADMLFH